MPIPKLREMLDMNRGTILESSGILLVLLAVIFNRLGYIYLNLVGIAGIVLQFMALSWEYKTEVDLSSKKTQFVIFFLVSIIILAVTNLIKISL